MSVAWGGVRKEILTLTHWWQESKTVTTQWERICFNLWILQLHWLCGVVVPLPDIYPANRPTHVWNGTHVSGGTVDSSKILEAVQVPGGGELAKCIRAAHRVASRRARNIAKDWRRESPGHFGKWRKQGASSVCTTGRQENYLSPRTVYSPKWLSLQTDFQGSVADGDSRVNFGPLSRRYVTEGSLTSLELIFRINACTEGLSAPSCHLPSAILWHSLILWRSKMPFRSSKPSSGAQNSSVIALTFSSFPIGRAAASLLD